MNSNEEWVKPYLVRLAGGVDVYLEAASRGEIQDTVRLRSVEWNTSSKIVQIIDAGSGRTRPKGERAAVQILRGR